MALDQRHEIDPRTGFAVDKDTGHIVGLMPAPPPRVALGIEWPKWIVPHESHIVRREVEGAPDHVSTPGYPDFHVNRADGVVTVLVKDEEDEKRATGEYKAPGSENGEEVKPEPNAEMLREVRSDVQSAERADAEALNKKIRDDQAALERDEAARRTQANANLSAEERAAAEQLAADERARAAEIVKH
jgi:hypothetical protein